MSISPQLRLRRLRQTETLRTMVRETKIEVTELIYSLFAVAGKGMKQDIASMPGMFRYPVDLLPREAEEVAKLGIPAVLLLGIPDYKVACIGPQTAATAARAGLRVDIVASEHTIPGLVEAMERYFQTAKGEVM